MMPDGLAAEPRVFRIAAGISFVDGLARGLMRRYGSEPESLARVTVLLPNRRAVRALREAFLRLSGGRALILPVMRPLGDLDEDEIVFAPEIAAADMELPPAAPMAWRQLQLTRLVDAWAARLPGGATSPAQAAELAAALGIFLDEVQSHGLDFAKLPDLVKQEFAEHWQRTLQFLSIITSAWPGILDDAGFMDNARRRRQLFALLEQLWRDAPPEQPIVAAGALGGFPAVDQLLKRLVRRPQGALVLPGLHAEMDETSWEALGPTHPQFALKQLLHAVNASRHEVQDWLDPEEAAVLPRSAPGRSHLLAEALRPAETTTGWRDAVIAVDALDGLWRIDAPSPREEAGAIALLMREALETPEKTAALITPDRQLARRVAAELGRWGIEVDDSAGAPLAQTPPAAFLLLTADMAASGFAPVPLLSALKHPLAAGGGAPGTFRAQVRDLERAVLRGPRPGAGSAGVGAAIAALGHDEERRRLGFWWRGLEARWQAFAKIMSGPAPLEDLLAAHVDMAEALAATADQSGAERLWRGDAGEQAAAFVEEVLDAAAGFALNGADYPGFLKALMGGRVVRPRYGRHPRLKIWGQIEARLQHADLVILGGLNEGVWPSDPGPDPWLSRPMREAFGLPAPERRIGLAAHDFLMAASAPQVVLTRSAKLEGAPTVPSRWLARLDAVLGERKIPLHPALSWFERLDLPEEVRPIARPAPAPPLAVRPKRLSVTQIEKWMRDPYSIYARHILKLSALDPIDADPGAADKGTIIHAVLDRFLKLHPHDLPPDALEQLVELGPLEFGALLGRPTVQAFWWPRFRHVAEWFIGNERERRGFAALALSEGKGELRLTVPGSDGQPFVFTLSAKADRIDRLTDGSLVIIDYKTGQAPQTRQLMAGYAPQLPLEALMAEAGAFADVPPARVTGLEFWRLHGGDPAADVKAVKDVDKVKDLARRGFEDLVRQFAREETPYLSVPRPEEVTAGDYDHLARIREWAGIGGLMDLPRARSEAGHE